MKTKDILMKVFKIGKIQAPVLYGKKAGNDLTKALNQLEIRNDTRVKIIDLINDDLLRQMSERVAQIDEYKIV